MDTVRRDGLPDSTEHEIRKYKIFIRSYIETKKILYFVTKTAHERDKIPWEF